jgi:hypothetical protein
MWNLNFNQQNMTVAVEPNPDVNSIFANAEPEVIEAAKKSVKATVKSFNPTTRLLNLDVTLQNPHSKQTYDVRGLVYTNDAGNQLRNPDGWDKVFDSPVMK